MNPDQDEIFKKTLKVMQEEGEHVPMAAGNEIIKEILGDVVQVNKNASRNTAIRLGLTVEKPPSLERNRLTHNSWLNQLPYFEVLAVLYLTRNYLPQFLFNIEVNCGDIKTLNQYHFNLNETQQTILKSPALSNSTIVITTCADGSHLASFLLLSLSSIPPELYIYLAKDFYIIPSPPTGWMTPDIFEWIVANVIIPHINDKRKRTHALLCPALILADGHCSRYSDRVYLECIRNNVDFVVEPAGSSDNIQINDRGVNGPFKAFLARARLVCGDVSAAEYRVNFVENVLDALSFALLRRTVRAAALKAGVWPLKLEYVMSVEERERRIAKRLERLKRQVAQLERKRK